MTRALKIGLWITGGAAFLVVLYFIIDYIASRRSRGKAAGTIAGETLTYKITTSSGAPYAADRTVTAKESGKVMFDKDGKIVYTTKAANEVLGTTTNKAAEIAYGANKWPAVEIKPGADIPVDDGNLYMPIVNTIIS